MDDKLFYNELSNQIKFVYIAIEDINKQFNDKLNVDRFWYSIQSFLVSVANISKILYPSPTSKESNKERARRLCMSLGLQGKSILADKKIRNCFEHYDEHLDQFLETNRNNYVDRNIGPIGMFNIDGSTTGFYMRHYDPNSKELIFKGLTYNLQEVINEIVKLKEKVDLKKS